MNSMLKFGFFVFTTIFISYIFLKPILDHDGEYRVVVVNISERPVSRIIVSGNGVKMRIIGPLNVGDMQDYYFVPSEDGELKYSITQDKQKFSGIIKENLIKGETGEIYVVIGELHKVKIYDEYDGAY